MKKLFVGIILLVIVIGACACGCDDGYVSKYDENYKYDGTSLIGKWQESDLSDEDYETYEFYSDNTLLRIRYILGIEIGRISGTYEVKDDNLMCMLWEGSGEAVYSTFSITDDYLVFRREGAELELVPFVQRYNKSNSELVGTWESLDYKNESFTFNEDCTAIAKGSEGTASIYYSTKDSYVYICTEFVEGTPNIEAMEYEIDGDTLTLSGQGEDETTTILKFKRVK